MNSGKKLSEGSGNVLNKEVSSVYNNVINVINHLLIKTIENSDILKIVNNINNDTASSVD